jgi:hypothetical protein
MMKKLCNAGYGPYKGVALTPEQCFGVFDFYLAHVPEKRHHDLRILEQLAGAVPGGNPQWGRPARDPQGPHPQRA